MEVRECSCGRGVDRKEYLAVVRLLLKRATIRDKWRALMTPNHWIHKAKRELLIP